MRERITVNGEARDYGGETLGEVVAAAGIDPARKGVAVAVNGAVAPRATWTTARLAAGDTVEIVQAKAGG